MNDERGQRVAAPARGWTIWSVLWHGGVVAARRSERSRMQKLFQQKDDAEGIFSLE